jgi:cobalt-zinc-cadmium efflux system outer membrane protein
VGLSQTIDWAGRGDAQAKVAGFEREAAEAELARARQALASDLLLALSEDQTARELDRLALRSIEVMDRFAALAERRRQAGDLGQVELDLARLAAAQARLRQAQTALAHTDAQQALIEVLDEVGPTLPSLPTVLPELALDQMGLEDLLDRLPELRAQRNRIAALRATARLRTQERRANPTVGLRGGREEDDTLLGISMSVPLFVRNNFQAEVDAANADHIQAQQEGQDAYRQAKARLLSAAKRYSLTQAAWQHWVKSGRVSLEQRIELLQRMWQAGEMGTAEYIVQLKQTIDTRADALELRAQLWRTWFDWLAASGHIEAWLEL